MRRSLRQIVSDACDLLLRDMKDAKWAILFVIAYFVIFRYFFNTLCPLVAMTGFPCPACGLTRAGVQLLQLHFAAAWAIHPFIYPLAALFVVFCVSRYLLLQRRVKVLQWCVAVVLVGMLLYYVWRMWRYFPGDPPMSYYSRNLLNQLIGLLHL